MDREEVKSEVRECIARITGIKSEHISDTAAFVNDLQLDSLSILEIAVNVEYAFKAKATEEELSQVKNLLDVVDLVCQKLAIEVPVG
jgi:acyl carrier protein